MCVCRVASRSRSIHGIVSSSRVVVVTFHSRELRRDSFRVLYSSRFPELEKFVLGGTRGRKAARGPLSPRGGTSGCANNDVERRGTANRGGKKRCAFGLPLLNRVCDRAALRCSPKAKIPVRLVSSRSLRDTSGSRHFSSPLSNRRNSRAAGGRTRIRRTRRKRRAYCVANETRTVPIPLSRLQRRSSWCLFGRGFLFLSRVISRVSLSIRIAFPSFERGEARVFLFFFPPFRPTTLLYQQTDERERERERERVLAREASACTAVSVPETTCGFRAKHRVTESAYVHTYN